MVQIEQNTYLDMQLNRRQFLFYLSIISLICISFGKKLFDPLKEQFETEQRARVETDSFIEQHKEQLKKIELGTTLCPVFIEKICPDATPELVVDFLKKLHITQVRLSMRWNKCVTEQNQIDLSFYLPWLKALTQGGIKITLSCGPIKSPRYPESYVPHHISYFLTRLSQPYYRSHPISLEQLEREFGTTFMGSLPAQLKEQIARQGYLPAIQQFVESGLPLAACALSYLDKLLPALKKELGAGMDQIVMFNPENESQNPFGTGKYIMKFGYMQQVCETILRHQPDAAFLFNCAGVSDTSTSSLEQTAALALYLQQLFPQASFTVGMDSYEEQDIFKFPYFNFFPDTISALSILYSDQIITSTLAELAEHGISFEATELQFERWVTLLREHPPGTLYHLQFMLLRYMNSFLKDDSQLVRVWGFEQFLKKYLIHPEDPEIKKLIPFIQRINTQSQQPL